MFSIKKLFSKNKESESSSLYTALSQSKNSFWKKISTIFSDNVQIDETLIERMEEILLESDINFETTVQILEEFDKLYKTHIKSNKPIDQETYKHLLYQATLSVFPQSDSTDAIVGTDDSSIPHIMLIVGVNGAGKTTTIAKLARLMQSKSISLIVGAGDTFRAGAVEQLERWAQKLSFPLVKRTSNSDPASVAYDTIRSALSQRKDVAIIDTAGRLQNNNSLMGELDKIARTIKKQIPSAPHETLLVIDGTSGQNAIEQAKKFSEVVKIDGIVVTKLDGTAKGGTLISIASALRIPIKYIGVGEKEDDLLPFSPQEYIKKIFEIN